MDESHRFEDTLASYKVASKDRLKDLLVDLNLDDSGKNSELFERISMHFDVNPELKTHPHYAALFSTKRGKKRPHEDASDSQHLNPGRTPFTEHVNLEPDPSTPPPSDIYHPLPKRAHIKTAPTAGFPQFSHQHNSSSSILPQPPLALANTQAGQSALPPFSSKASTLILLAWPSLDLLNGSNPASVPYLYHFPASMPQSHEAGPSYPFSLY